MSAWSRMRSDSGPVARIRTGVFRAGAMFISERRFRMAPTTSFRSSIFASASLFAVRAGAGHSATQTSPSVPGRACQSSSERNGMKGCRSLSTVPNTRWAVKRTAWAPGASAPA